MGSTIMPRKPSPRPVVEATSSMDPVRNLHTNNRERWDTFPRVPALGAACVWCCVRAPLHLHVR